MSSILRNGGVFRAGPGRRERFALLDIQTLEDRELSWKATGIWATLISRTDDWQTRVPWLTSVSTNREGSVRSGLKELEQKGYLLRRQRQRADTTFGPMEYLVLAAKSDVVLPRGFAERWLEGEEDNEGWDDSGGIVRVDRRLNRRFAQIDVGGLVNPKLSFKAKGLWCYLMSRQEDWDTPMRRVEEAKRDGRESTYTGITQLIEAGYIARPDQERREDGTWAPVVYWFFERPLSVLQQEANELVMLGGPEPLGENPDAVKIEPRGENPDAVKTKPRGENPDAASKDSEVLEKPPRGENPDAVEGPRTGFPDAGSPNAGNRQTGFGDILSTKTLRTNEPSTSGTYGQEAAAKKSVAEESVKEGPTDRQTVSSVDDLWERFAKAPIETFLDACLEFFDVGWSRPRREVFEAEFGSFDFPEGRVWLLEKFEKLAADYSGVGLYDMILQDLHSPRWQPRVRATRKEEVRPEEKSHDAPVEESAGLDEQVEAVSITLCRPGDYWEIAKEDLRGKVNAKNFEQWFEKLRPLGFQRDGGWVFEVDDPFVKVWVEDNYVDLVEKALKDAGAPVREVRIEREGRLIVKRPEIDEERLRA